MTISCLVGEGMSVKKERTRAKHKGLRYTSGILHNTQVSNDHTSHIVSQTLCSPRFHRIGRWLLITWPTEPRLWWRHHLISINRWHHWNMTSGCRLNVLLEARKSVEQAQYLLQVSTEYFCHQMHTIITIIIIIIHTFLHRCKVIISEAVIHVRTTGRDLDG